MFSVPCFSFIVKHKATEEPVSLGWVGLVNWPALTPGDSKMTEQRHLLQCPSWLSWFSLDCSFNTMRKDRPPFFIGGLVCLRSVCLAPRSAVCRGRGGCSRVVYILYFNSLPIQCPLLHPYSPLSLWFYEPHSLVLWELMSFHLTCSPPLPFQASASSPPRQQIPITLVLPGKYWNVCSDDGSLPILFNVESLYFHY